MVVLLFFFPRRTSLIQRTAALSSGVRQMEVLWALSGMCFSLGLIAETTPQRTIALLHFYVIVQ